MVNNHQVTVEGTGAWKTIKVVNERTEIVVEKKFYKADFGEVWKDPQYKRWIDGLLEKALIRTSVSDNDIDIDPESYEEMRALHDHVMSPDA
jgi:hypothetical protein